MIWKPLTGNYEVSDEGQIRNGKTGRVLKAKYLPPWGYLQVTLSIDGCPLYYYVHRAVLEAFVGHCPEGMQTRHLDGDRENNHLDNLAWGTPKENTADTERHGRTARGAVLPHTKLTKEQVFAIYAEAGLHREIAVRYGVSRSLVQRIKAGKHGVVARA